MSAGETVTLYYPNDVTPEYGGQSLYDTRSSSTPSLNPTRMFVDGIEVTPSPTYTFSEGGEHTVHYQLTDPTTIAYKAFNYCRALTSVIIPEGITLIDAISFASCTSLSTVILPSTLTIIGSYAFGNCTSLTSIVCKSATSPSIQNDTFADIKSGGTITVPVGALGYDTCMSTERDYLGYYGWTKVESSDI